VTFLNQTPSAFAQLLQAEEVLGVSPELALRSVVFGGEALNLQSLAPWWERHAEDRPRLVNMYGITETTVHVTYRPLGPSDLSGSPGSWIGRAIPDLAVHVLDPGQRPVPVGVAGELCVGGAGLARGYHERPGLTAERFIPDPFAGTPGARLYRSGDLARWRPTGELEYLGRIDHQVKIRGFRIELGEIEAALAREPEVREAVVLARDAGGERSLVAYLVPAEAREDLVDELRVRLRGTLPEYMLPAAFVLLEAMPLTPTGKVDRRALLRIEPARLDSSSWIAPRTPAEERLAGIWREVLGLESVGAGDHFFHLGGHSLLATRLVAGIRGAFGVDLPLRAVFEAPVLAEQALAIAALDRSLVVIPRRSGAAPAPLSFAQERLWFLDRLQPGGSSYNLLAALRLTGRLDAAALASALAEIVRRHEALRTTFAEREGTPVQIVAAPFAPDLPVIDLRALPGELREAEARRLAAAESARPFDLARGPLLRAALLHLDGEARVLLLDLHHVVSDLWSMEVLVREATVLYEAFAQGLPSPLPELPIQYADFAAWQRGWLQGDELERQLSYWRGELAGAPALLELPTDRPRPPVRTFRGMLLTESFPAELGEALKRIGQEREATTPFMTLAAALQALLGRLAGQEDVLVGSPVANRNRPEVEGLIGFFVNTLVLRSRLASGTFADLLARVRRAALDAYDHQDLPFEKLVEDLQVPRSLSYNPLFQVMFAHQTARSAAIRLPGLAVSPFDYEVGTAVFDLGFEAAELPDGALQVRLELSSDLFEATTGRRLLERFRQVLEAVAADPERPLADLPLLSEAERHQLLAEWTDTRSAAPAPGPVHRLFEAQAARAPEAVAVEHGRLRLTYRELDARAERIAARLRTLGVGPEERVGLLLERTPDLVAAILGIWKAGGAYVPLDPSLPEARIAYMVGDAGLRVVLTRAELESIGEESAEPVRQAVSPRDLAYLIYTSGTTGQPKAVQVEHGNLAHTLRAVQEAFGFSAGDRMPCLAPFSFDIFLFELLGPLLAGGTAVLFDLRPTLDVPALVEALDGMTLLHAVPALMREIVERVRQRPVVALRRVFVGGDAVPPDLLSDMRAAFPAARVTVLYGPTEATILCSRYEADGREDRNLLGRPLADAELRVVDPAGLPTPIGVPGELWIGGPGVARGYLNREELTAEKFGDRRWYRTGDLARWLADGNLEFLGRLDQQVKVRGFRVELGEIESVLVEHPSVRQAVVLARGEGEAKHLAAYVVAPETLLGELRGRVAERLPEYMMPSGWVFLEELPLTAHGKVDRRALARIEPEKATEGTVPRTPTEELLAGIWCGLLGVERVGAGSDFFDLGGHSLLATRLASRVQQAFGVELPLRAFFEASVLADQALRIEQGTGSALPPIVPRALAGPAPLSFAQERLWFLDRLAPGSPLYNMPSALRLTGSLDVARLEHALREVVRRHEVLRTTFREAGGGPLQVISPEVALDLPVVDLRALPQPEHEARRLAAAEALRPFDLEWGPLVRAALVRLEDETWNALFNLHHIVGDGWSFGVLVGEVAALYGGSPLPELPVQYADFALWQREWLRGEILESQLAWWQAELEEAPTLLELPTDRPRPATQSFRGALEGFALPAGLAEDLSALARREGATLFMTLLAAFQALLSRYAGRGSQDDLLVGSPVAGRNRLELEGLIGFFVNTLVLRGRLAGQLGGETDGPAFRELLARTRSAALGAYAHQDLPFERLVEMLGVERSLAHGPLVQVTFALQNAPTSSVELPGLRLEPEGSQGHTAKFDLSLSLSEVDGALVGGAEYASDLFDRATVVRLLGHFETLLAGAAADPGRRLAELPLLSATEARQMQVEWNATASGEPGEPVHRLVEARAAERPDAPAVVSERGTLTYGQLDRRSNRLARRLRGLGVGPETVVALRLPRSPELVIAALGVLKAGAAYLPVDPAHPAERLDFILRDSGARLLLDDPSFADLLGGEEGELPSPALRSLAYVIYTSGSTGAPKGTELTHAGLSNLAAWHRRTYGLAPEDRTTLLAGPGFDASVWEVWPALSAGAALHVPPQEIVASAPDLLAWMAERRITQSFLPTPLAEAVLAEGMPQGLGLRVVLTGGDRLSRRPSADVPFALVNHYGPTETTVVSTAGLVDPSGDRSPSIGRPIANLRVYLLDRTMRPVPVGVPGELFVAGAGLARGYRGRPDLTAERFVPDPFDGAGERLYRTGDLARFLPGGEIEFLGRLDHQVKVRGFRIELGEIEAVLGRHPSVRQAAVLSREGRLVAYVAGEGSREDLRGFLAERLPEPMVPTGWVFLESLPLTANGKVDRRALGRIAPAPLDRDPAAPRTPTEELLAGLWSGLLGLEEVGSGDSFFDLGGHSLLATRLVSRVRDVFGVELPLRALFETPRLSDLALRIESRQGGRSLDVIPRRSDHSPAPLSFAQERLWFLDRLQPGGSSYNLLVALRLTGRLDVAALSSALAGIVRRHESLRTTFEEQEGAPIQVVCPTFAPALPVIDLRALPAREAEARRLATAEAARPFDLARGPLLRAALLRLDGEAWVLLLDLHHVVSDLWSMEVLVRESTALYEAFAQGLPSPLPELPIQYADFAAWQRGWLQGDVLERQLFYWRGELAGAPTLLELPTDRPRPPVRTFRGAVLTDLFPAELGEALRRTSQKQDVTPFMTLLAALQALLGRLSGQEDVVVGSPVANRTRSEVEGLIGFFVNTLALRGRLAPGTFSGLLAQVRRAALDAYAHQDLPFEKLVEDLQIPRSLSYNPLFQVIFAHQAASAAAVRLPGLALSPFDYAVGTSLFDLGFQVAERADGALQVRLELASDLFDATTGRRLLESFRRVLEAVAADPDRSLADLPLLSEAERHQLLAEWTDTRSAAPATTPVHRLFEAQAARTPEAVAVERDGQSLTYRELDLRAERIAARLRALGVGPEARVGLLMERTPELVAAILGIWKAGGAYVPLDPSLPEARIAYMVGDAGLRVLLTRAELASIGEESAEPVRQAASPGDLAYLIYTSGTTGQPKAVLVEHGNLAHTLRASQEAFGFTAGDRMPCLAPFSFDIFLFELLGPLLSGGTSVLFDLRPTLDVPALVESLDGMTLLHAVPALMRQVVEQVRERGACPSLRRVFVGGDAVPADLLTDMREAFPAARVTVLYGPTEATIICSRHEADGREDRSLLGRPLAEVEMRVVDREGMPAPIGVPGELWIGGPGVTRGYLDRDELTAERFHRWDGRRWYRTGDLARWLADGNLEFLGRIDNQVKIRGFRIELGEIEAALADHPAVREAVVLALGEGEDRRLAAYVVAEEKSAELPGELPTRLREALAARLPEYMVPAAWAFLDELPVTAHGKVDRRALAQMAVETGLQGERAEPRDVLELELAFLWSEVLGLPGVGVRDNFFALGGHSLLAVQLMARVRQRFGRELPLAALFQGGTVEAMAALLRDGAPAGESSCLVPIQPSGLEPPLFLVHPAGGDVLCFAGLARHLGPDQPVYGLQSRGLAADEQPLGRLEEMAALYVREIRRVQPEGPYNLGGWSLGGLIAFEMAGQLQAAGEEVALLALLDTSLEIAGDGRELESDAIFLADIAAYVENLWDRRLDLDQEDLEGLAPEEQKRLLLERLREVDFLPPGAGLEQVGRVLEVYKANSRAARAYEPRPYAGTVTLFQAAEGPQISGWERLTTRPVEVVAVPGHHLNLLAEPHVGTLARLLGLRLQEVRAESAAQAG
jgi:amino acid adenylation domain-containing protein